jgi:hypothetical protein
MIGDQERLIRGRKIERHDRGSAIIWQEVTRSEPIVSPSYDPQSGETRSLIQHQADKVVWRERRDPHESIQALAQQSAGEFDPREPDDLNGLIEEAKATRYSPLAELLEAIAAKSGCKIKPRPLIGGIALGKCLVTRGVGKLPVGPEELRGFIALHANGDWGAHGRLGGVELDGDMRWAPVLFGVAVENAVSVEAGEGLVQSVYPRVFVKTRGEESLRVTSLIGVMTVCWTPNR